MFLLGLNDMVIKVTVKQSNIANGKSKVKSKTKLQIGKTRQKCNAKWETKSQMGKWRKN